VFFALRLAQTNVPPGFTLILDVRDVPALPNELRAKMATWLPVMSAGVAADVLKTQIDQVLLGRAGYVGS